MPKSLLPTNNLHWSMERPVILTVIRDLMNNMGISSQTPINFYGIDQKAIQDGGTVNDQHAIRGVPANRWPFDERVFIDVTEEFDQDRMLSLQIHQPNTIPYFKDSRLGVVAKPAYANCKVVVAIKYRARDENQASMWRNQLRARTAMMRDINLHEASCHYELAPEFLEIIQEIHRVRELQGGYGEDFDTYLANHLDPRVAKFVDPAGGNVTWGLRERHIRIQGYSDFQGVPERGAKEEDHDNWMVSYNYTFWYDKPIVQVISYPFVVHHQLLSEKYRQNWKPYRLEDQPRIYSAANLAMAYFETDTRILRTKFVEGVKIPEYMAFKPKTVLPSTINVLLAIVLMNPDDPMEVCDLHQLGDVSLADDVVEFLESTEWPWINKDFQSIFQLSFYKDGQLCPKGSLTVDQHLRVRSTEPMEVRSNYHIRLGLVTDLTYLPTRAIDRLQLKKGCGQRIINTIDASIGNLGTRKDVKKNRLTADEIKLILGQLPSDWQRQRPVNYPRQWLVEYHEVKKG